jgi:peptidase M50-like protein
MRRELARVLPNLAFLALLFGGQWLLRINVPSHLATRTLVASVAWLLAALVTGIVVHELGHALAVRLVGERVLGIQLGGQLARVTVSLGTVPVSMGLGLGGSVSYRAHRLSAARRAAVLAAGPAASVLLAPLCLLLPVPRWEAAYLALAVLASALQDLVPGSTPGGGSTDGAKLWRTPARLRADTAVRRLLADPDWHDRPAAADILISGFGLDVPAAEDALRELSSQPARLLVAYLKPWTLPDRPVPDVTHIVHVLSWKVLVTGDLPAQTADLAASRVEWVIDHLDREHPDKRTPVHNARHTLAVARLRQGRPNEVRQLCAGALAAELDPDDRATVLATVAMARHALLLSGGPQLEEALALDPDAPLVSEAARVLGGGWDAALAALPT